MTNVDSDILEKNDPLDSKMHWDITNDKINKDPEKPLFSMLEMPLVSQESIRDGDLDMLETVIRQPPVLSWGGGSFSQLPRMLLFA